MPTPVANLYQRATISDVAERADVSIATVSRAINNPSSVAQPTLLRIQSAIEELEYIPHAGARHLASSKTNTIGLLLPGISGAYFSPMLRGVEAAASKEGYDLLVYVTQRRSSANPNTRRPMGEHNTDGLIVFTDSLTPADLTRLNHLGLPLVMLHQTPPAGLDIPYVTYENKRGAIKLVDHLVQVHGCQRIAFLAGPEGNEDSSWREVGYREALQSHGLSLDPALIGLGGFEEDIAEHAVREWMERGLQMDAILAGDDEAALGAIHALQSFGVRVPEDVAVVGFDDQSICRIMNPPLTTMHAPIELAGQVAVEQLVRLIQTGHADPLTLLPTNLVIRQSCGCP